MPQKALIDKREPTEEELILNNPEAMASIEECEENRRKGVKPWILYPLP